MVLQSDATLASLRVQLRVIYALLMREILTRYGRHNIGFLWLFVEPMSFTLGVTALWTATKAIHGSNLPITAFAVTGYSSVLLWRNMPNRCINAIEPNLSLLFHRNVKIFDIFAARILLEAAGASISFVILTLVFSALGQMDLPEDILMVLKGWFALAFFGAALAILLGALAYEYELIDKVWHPISYIIFPISGAAFLVDSLPPSVQKIVLYVPMVHGMESVRDGFFGSKFAAHYDLTYLVIVSAILMLLGLAYARRISEQVIPE